MSEPLVFSVAHSSASPGAKARAILIDEYSVSLRASIAAFQDLAGDFPCMLFDSGPFPPARYADLKVAQVNASKAKLAIEIHCNASDNEGACYSEVIHHAQSIPGIGAASAIALALSEGFRGRHKIWRSRGARPNTIADDGHKLFFLERTTVPALVVEGLFISNAEQAAWLASEGGAEAYGLLVAEGIRNWLGGRRM